MGDKYNNREKIDKLIEAANELEKRELALNRESEQLERLRAALDERERKLAEAQTKPQPVKEPEDALFGQRPLAPEKPAPAPQPEPPVQAPAAPAQEPEAPVEQKKEAPADETKAAAPENKNLAKPHAAEINDILKSIFWDYSKSVHQISSQLSTVTAAMMCAAVALALEDRGIDAKDVFLDEMGKMLKDQGLGDFCVTPPGKPSPASAPEEEPPAEPKAEPEYKSQPLSEGDAAAEIFEAEGGGMGPLQPADDVLRIENVQEFRKLGEYGFRNDDQIVAVQLPEGVEQLPGSFFYGCRKLTEVWLPESLLEIGPYAFYGCEQLHTVHLPETAKLREIGEYAFAMCSDMKTFAVPATVEVLGTSVFRFCGALEKLSIDKNGSLRTIGSHLLQNCTALQKLRLPDAITTIPTSMFYGCSSLKKVVAKGVDTIEDYAFYGNTALRIIRIRTKKAIAAQAFEGCSPDLEIEYLNY